MGLGGAVGRLEPGPPNPGSHGGAGAKALARKLCCVCVSWDAAGFVLHEKPGTAGGRKDCLDATGKGKRAHMSLLETCVLDRPAHFILTGHKPCPQSCQWMLRRPANILTASHLHRSWRCVLLQVMHGREGDHILVIYLSEPVAAVPNETLEDLCQARRAVCSMSFFSP